MLDLSYLPIWLILGALVFGAVGYCVFAFFVLMHYPGTGRLRRRK